MTGRCKNCKYLIRHNWFPEAEPQHGGTCDALHVLLRMNNSDLWFTKPMYVPGDFYCALWSKPKETVGVPVSPWIEEVEDGHVVCAYRVIAGSDGSLPHRVAFIEKTPRVRVGDFFGEDYDNKRWESRGWKGDGPCDTNSRDWCDAKLRLLGYILQ